MVFRAVKKVENKLNALTKIALYLNQGPYIKYVGGVVAGFLWGVLNYFRHMLMSHEIFFKIFDGQRNIFLCSIFLILFFKLKRLQHKISKLAIKEIYKRLDMLIKSHPLSRYRVNSGKNKEKCFMHFNSDARVFVLSNLHKM